MKTKMRLVLLVVLLMAIVAGLKNVTDSADFFGLGCYLSQNKVLIKEASVDGWQFDIYAERGEEEKIKNLNCFEGIALKAINDFPAYMKRHYPKAVWRATGSRQVAIIFISRMSWMTLTEALCPHNKEDGLGWHLNLPGQRIIFLRYGEVLSPDNTIRHELFHQLVAYYGVERYLKDEAKEEDAYAFQKL